MRGGYCGTRPFGVPGCLLGRAAPWAAAHASCPALRAWPLCVPVGGGPPARSPHASLRLGSVDLEARPGPAAAHRHRGQAHRILQRPPHRRHLVCGCVRLAPHPPCMRYKVRLARTKLAKTGHFERAGRVLYRTCDEEGCVGRTLYRSRPASLLLGSFVSSWRRPCVQLLTFRRSLAPQPAPPVPSTPSGAAAGACRACLPYVPVYPVAHADRLLRYG